MSVPPKERTGFAGWLVPALFLITWVMTPTLFAQQSAEKSLRELKPAAGLEATLWASEPLLANPTNIDIDSRGRVWDAEGLNYRLTQGGNCRKAPVRYSCA